MRRMAVISERKRKGRERARGTPAYPRRRILDGVIKHRNAAEKNIASSANVSRLHG
jgi:hypothetical protein